MAPNLPTENYSLLRTLKGGKGRFSKGPRHSPASHPWKRKTPRQIDRWLQHYQRVRSSKGIFLGIQGVPKSLRQRFSRKMDENVFTFWMILSNIDHPFIRRFFFKN